MRGFAGIEGSGVIGLGVTAGTGAGLTGGGVVTGMGAGEAVRLTAGDASRETVLECRPTRDSGLECAGDRGRFGELGMTGDGADGGTSG